MSKFNKLTKTLVAVLGVATLGAAALGVSSVSASAEDTYACVGSQFFSADSGTVNTYKAKPGVTYSGTGNFRTEVTGLTPGSDVTITYNGAFDNTGNTIIVLDSIAEKTLIADSMVLTFTSLEDSSKKISYILWTHSHPITMYTAALTDEITFAENGYPMIGDTEQNAMGWDNGRKMYLAHGSFAGGWTANTGALFGGEIYPRFNTNGVLTFTGNKAPGYDVVDNNVVADIDSEEFISAHKHLAGTKYEDIYTVENAKATLASLFSGDGMMVTMKFYNIKSDSIAFHLRGWNNVWIDGTDKSFSCFTSDSFSSQKTTTLEAGKTYKIVDVLNMYTTFREDGGYNPSVEQHPTMEGWVNEGVQDRGNDTYFSTKSNANKTFTVPTNQKTYAIFGYTRSGINYASNRYTAQLFTFDVTGVSEITKVENGKEVSQIVKDGTEITLGELTNTQAKAALGWVDSQGNLYKGGTVVEASGDETYTATYVDFGVIEGASVRLNAPYGIRFTTQIEVAALQAMENYGLKLKDIVTTITSTNSNEKVEIEIDTDKAYASEDQNYVMFNAALVDILPENLTRVYFATTTMTLVDANGVEYTVTSTVASEEGRSYAQVLKAAYEDVTDGDVGEYTDGQVNRIKAIYEDVVTEDTLATVSVEIFAVVGDVTLDLTADYQAQIAGYFAQNNYKIGDTVVIPVELANSLAGNGYVVDEAQSVLTAVCGVRGAAIKIVYVPVSA